MYIFSKKNTKTNVEINFEPIKSIKAPIKKGEKVGVLRVYENNIEIGSVNVLANETVLEKTYFDIINDIVDNWSI